MRATTAIVVALLACVVSAADERSVNFDASVDFSKITTFAIRPGTINSQKPELNNRLFLQKLDAAIRSVLTGKRLREVTDRPDLSIDFSVAGVDYSVIGGRRGIRIPDGPRGIRGTVIPGTGPQPELFTEGTLIIDMTLNATGTLVWRGTYRDEERSGPGLARKLPEDAKSLLSEYPPRRR